MIYHMTITWYVKWLPHDTSHATTWYITWLSHDISHADLLHSAELSNCTGDVRLVGPGSTPSQGRVKVCYGDQWGSVCDYNWNAANAAVVCRQLGYNGGWIVMESWSLHTDITHHAHMHTHMHTPHTCTHAHTLTHIHTLTLAHTLTHAHTLTYTCTHPHTHPHPHTPTHALCIGLFISSKWSLFWSGDRARPPGQCIVLWLGDFSCARNGGSLAATGCYHFQDAGVICSELGVWLVVCGWCDSCVCGRCAQCMTLAGSVHLGYRSCDIRL